MQLVAFTAKNPGSALAQVHERLGPDAVIVSVRQKRPGGLSWLWNSRNIEVTACVPGHEPERGPAGGAAASTSDAKGSPMRYRLSQDRAPMAAHEETELERQFRAVHGEPRLPKSTVPPATPPIARQTILPLPVGEGRGEGEPGNRRVHEALNDRAHGERVPFEGKPQPAHGKPGPASRMALERSVPGPLNGRWRSIGWLETHGLLPAFTSQLEEKANVLYGRKSLPTMQAEWSAVTDLIVCHWLPARQAISGTGRPHVFIGPPGSGKTTVLCKWMSLAVLFQQHRVRVWRLDGYSANSADFLALHCEATGAPLERFWERPDEEADLQFVDLPGVDPRNESAMSSLSDQLSALPNPHVHLVLNAAYESSILLEQFRAFECFGPEDLIFTHLDEETRRVKLWNFVLGTKCPISFLSAGQKIPGDFHRAEPALLFPQKNNG